MKLLYNFSLIIRVLIFTNFALLHDVTSYYLVSFPKVQMSDPLVHIIIQVLLRAQDERIWRSSYGIGWRRLGCDRRLLCGCPRHWFGHFILLKIKNRQRHRFSTGRSLALVPAGSFFALFIKHWQLAFYRFGGHWCRRRYCCGRLWMECKSYLDWRIVVQRRHR